MVPRAIVIGAALDGYYYTEAELRCQVEIRRVRQVLGVDGHAHSKTRRKIVVSQQELFEVIAEDVAGLRQTVIVQVVEGSMVGHQSREALDQAIFSRFQEKVLLCCWSPNSQRRVSLAAILSAQLL